MIRVMIHIYLTSITLFVRYNLIFILVDLMKQWNVLLYYNVLKCLDTCVRKCVYKRKFCRMNLLHIIYFSVTKWLDDIWVVNFYFTCRRPDAFCTIHGLWSIIIFQLIYTLLFLLPSLRIEMLHTISYNWSGFLLL